MVGNGENAGNLFLQCFLLCSKQSSFISHICHLQSFVLILSKILSYGKELTHRPLPNNDSLWTKLKAFADNTLTLAEKIVIIYHSVEDIVGKGEMAGYKHFLLCTQGFQKPSISRSLKAWNQWYREDLIPNSI